MANEVSTQLDNNKAERLSKRQTAHVTFYLGIPAHPIVDICVDIVIEEDSSDMDSPEPYHQHFNGWFKMTCHWLKHCSLPKLLGSGFQTESQQHKHY